MAENERKRSGREGLKNKDQVVLKRNEPNRQPTRCAEFAA